MAEKNTLSILETIKKKMKKLDKKPEPKAEVVSDESFNDDEDFEYISSGEEIPEKKEEDPLDLDIKTGMDDLSDLISDTLTSDEISSNDLDLDSEEKFSKEEGEKEDEIATPSLEKDSVDDAEEGLDWLGNPIEDNDDSNISEALVDEDVSEIDIEDQLKENSQEDELDLGSAIEDNASDDINLDEEDNIEDQLKENSQEDELDLGSSIEDDSSDEINLEEEDDIEDQFKENSQEDELDLGSAIEDNASDDINLEEEDDIEDQFKENFQEDELDLENDITDSDLNEESDDKNFLEELEEIKTESDQIEKEDVLLSDLDSSIAEEDINVEFPTKVEDDVEVESSENNDELDFDDLEFDSENDDEFKFEDAELFQSEELKEVEVKPEKDVVELKARVEELPISESIIIEDTESQIPENHNLDLEFEKEMMSIKPKISEDYHPIEEEVEDVKDNYPNDQQVEVMQSSNSDRSLKKNSDLKEITMSKVGESVNKLLEAKNTISGVSQFAQGPALSELASQLMEPKLEKWFHDNLPELVEKIVREEIKKMIPKSE